MPNNVENVLRVSGPAADVASFESACRARGARYPLTPLGIKLGETDEEPEEVPLSFNGICPVPPEILAAGYDSAGYDWQCKHWGTKWDAYDAPELLRTANGSLVYLFQTAWAPPGAWLRTACERFTTLTFELFARDEYPYCVSIEAHHYDGELQWEECYGETAKESA